VEPIPDGIRPDRSGAPGGECSADGARTPLSGFRIVEDDLAGPEIREPLRLHAEGMLANSPKDACHFLDPACPAGVTHGRLFPVGVSRATVG